MIFMQLIAVAAKKTVTYAYSAIARQYTANKCVRRFLDNFSA